MTPLPFRSCDETGWLAAERDLREHGYAAVKSVIAPAVVASARRSVEAWHERTRDRTTRDMPNMGGGPVVWNLQNKDRLFLDILFTRPELERLLVHVLNDPWYRSIPENRPNYILRAFIARAGLAALPFHIDSFIPYEGEHVLSVQSVFVLEPMRAGAGATLVVPGSHRSARWAEQVPREQAVAIEADAGDLLLWDSRLWHAAEDNPEGSTRWLLIATFTRWWIKQAFDVTEALPDEIYEHLTDSQRAVLGFCSRPWRDESEGIRTQHGYEVLAAGRAGKPKALP
ncbi:MAG TPA: phytanoyl-CoA dioxygenase family protein [Candidatus Limnocylindrales bacterium]|nr:phytanoyl-CoA dioxygenase family protein [Candidatus Limnocylindrales bacterium]